MVVTCSYCKSGSLGEVEEVVFVVSQQNVEIPFFFQVKMKDILRSG